MPFSDELTEELENVSLVALVEFTIVLLVEVLLGDIDDDVLVLVVLGLVVLVLVVLEIVVPG